MKRDHCGFVCVGSQVASLGYGRGSRPSEGRDVVSRSQVGRSRSWRK